MPAIPIEPLSVDEIYLDILAEENEQSDEEFMTSELADGGLHSNKNLLSLISLTIGLSGLQGVFAIQFSYGSLYLLSLGLSKPLVALAWVAGPLAGALVQPYVGIRSDQSKHRWGKRRPYIAAGGIGVILSLFGLAWVEDIVTIFLQPLGAGLKVTSTAIEMLAIIFIYSLCAAIQPVQCGIRALIVEQCPKHQQAEANAWASRLIEFGNIATYLSAYIPLQHLFPFLAHAQFKILSLIVSMGLVITLTITCLRTIERPGCDDENTNEMDGILERLSSIKESIRKLSPEINQLCQVQFFSWMGWFPFLYYITSYISQIYIAQPPYLEKTSLITKSNDDNNLFDAAGVGSLALLLHTTISLFTGFVVPIIVQQTTQHTLRVKIFSLAQRGTKASQLPFFTLKYLWLLSHALFVCCILGISVVNSLSGVILIVGFMGVSRAVTSWAPYSLLATKISFAGEPDSLSGSMSMRAGVALGIHNMAIAIPQILSALICSAIFWFMSTDEGDGGISGLEWIFRLSAVPASIAAFLTLKLAEDKTTSGFAESGCSSTK